MDKEKKEKFINTYMEEMKKEFISKIDKMPEHWNGFELRHYIAQKFNSEDLLSKDNIYSWKTYKVRRKDCENDIIVLNL